MTRARNEDFEHDSSQDDFDESNDAVARSAEQSHRLLSAFLLIADDETRMVCIKYIETMAAIDRIIREKGA